VNLLIQRGKKRNLGARGAQKNLGIRLVPLSGVMERERVPKKGCIYDSPRKGGRTSWREKKRVVGEGENREWRVTGQHVGQQHEGSEERHREGREKEVKENSKGT